MSNLDTLLAARDKLRTLLDATPGTLRVVSHRSYSNTPERFEVISGADKPVALTLFPELITTLHRTIEAQLWVIHCAIEVVRSSKSDGVFKPEVGVALVIANAVLDSTDPGNLDLHRRIMERAS